MCGGRRWRPSEKQRAREAREAALQMQQKEMWIMQESAEARNAERGKYVKASHAYMIISFILVTALVAGEWRARGFLP